MMITSALCSGIIPDNVQGTILDVAMEPRFAVCKTSALLLYNHSSPETDLV